MKSKKRPCSSTNKVIQTSAAEKAAGEHRIPDGLLGMMDDHTPAHFPRFIPGTWAIDPDWSSVSFELHHRHARSSNGHFHRFDGTMSIDTDPARSTFLLRLEAASLTTGNAERNGYLRSVSFLDEVTFPSIIIRSTGIRHVDGRVVLDSSPRIRSATRPPTLHVEQLDSSSLAPAFRTRVDFTSTSTIQSRAFGLPNNPLAGQRDVTAAPDGVTFRFELAAQMNRGSSESKSKRFVAPEGATLE
jgi:polyisoprenoid-binding protein YceI